MKIASMNNRVTARSADTTPLAVRLFIAATAVFFSAFFFAVPQVSAHATPIAYQPKASSLLKNVPPSLSIYFSERIEPSASGISIFAPDGSRADLGNPEVDANQTLYRVGVKDRGVGTYTVSWQVVSADDGHFTKGAFLFSVGKETEAQGNLSRQIQIQHLTSIPEAITIWVELLGQAILVSLLVLWRFFGTLFKENPEETKKSFSRRWNILLGAGIVLVVAGAVSFLILKTLDLEELHSTNFLITLQSFIRTTGGIFAVYRVIFTFIFMGIFFGTRKKIKENGLTVKPFFILLAPIILILLARTRVSHAAATHFHPYFAILIHTTHLFFKELWVGTLAVFVFAILPVLKKGKNAAATARSVIYLSKLLSIALGVVGATGAYIIWLDLKNPKNIFTTEWGSHFIILFIFSGILAIVRLYHQCIADRASVRVSQNKAGDRETRLASFIPYSLALEMVLGVVVLLVTSYLIITTPPFTSEQYAFEKTGVSQGEAIALSVHPYAPKEFLVTVTDANRTEAQVSNLIVTLTNQENNIGPIAAAVTKRFEGGYSFSRDLLSPAGTWKINITAERPGAYDAVESFSVHSPQDIESTRIDSDIRSFGSFEWMLVIMIVIFAGFCFVIYRMSNHMNKSVEERGGSGTEETAPNRLFGGISVFFGFAIIIALVWFVYGSFIVTDFQKRCEKNGNFWLQSVPLLNGRVLSSDTVTGCTLSAGSNHFADEREYSYFMRGGEAAASLKLIPEKLVAGKPIAMMISLANVENGRNSGPAQELTIEHDRILHVLIVGQDLQTFAHIHSEDLGSITPEMLKTGTFPLHYTFPKAGHYTVAINYWVRAKQFINQFFVDVGGAPPMDQPTKDMSHDKMFDGYHVTLDVPRIVPSVQVKINYTIEKDGAPVTDLEPYLSAAMHVGIVDEHLQGFIHAHGETYLPGSAAIQALFQNYVNYHNHFVPDKFGPKIQARLTFPHEGLYEVFGEFKHNGKIITTSFMVKVEKN